MVDLIKDSALKKLESLEFELVGIKAKGLSALKSDIEKKKRFIMLYKVDPKTAFLIVKEAKKSVSKFLNCVNGGDKIA